MASPRSSWHPRADNLFPAYFTRRSVSSLGWPFILAFIGVLVFAFGSVALMLILG